MTFASEAIEEFQKANNYKEKVKTIQLIAINVRNTEAAFYRKFAQILIEANKNKSGIQVCEYCIRNYFFNPDLKKMRDDVNDKIIHKMDSGKPIEPRDFHFAIDYYNEVLKLPLMDPIHIEEKDNVPFCKSCLKKNRERGIIK